MKFVCIFCTFLKAVFAHICANTARCLKLINSGGGVINGWLTRTVFRSLRLDVTLCRDSILCPFDYYLEYKSGFKFEFIYQISPPKDYVFVFVFVFMMTMTNMVHCLLLFSA